jgi:ribosomal protein L32
MKLNLMNIKNTEDICPDCKKYKLLTLPIFTESGIRKSYDDSYVLCPTCKKYKIPEIILSTLSEALKYSRNGRA